MTSPIINQIGAVFIPVSDVNRAAEWYHQRGFPCTQGGMRCARAAMMHNRHHAREKPVVRCILYRDDASILVYQVAPAGLQHTAQSRHTQCFTHALHHFRRVGNNHTAKPNKHWWVALRQKRTQFLGWSPIGLCGE